MSDVFLLEVAGSEPEDVTLGESIAAAAVAVKTFTPASPALTANIRIIREEVTFVWEVAYRTSVAKAVGWDTFHRPVVEIRVAWDKLVASETLAVVHWDTLRHQQIDKTVGWGVLSEVRTGRTVWVGSLADRVSLLVALELV